MDPQTIAGAASVVSATALITWTGYHAATPLEDKPLILRWSICVFSETRAVAIHLFTGRVTPRTPRVRRTTKSVRSRPGRPDYDRIFWLEIEDRTWRELNCPEEHSPYATGITHGGTGRTHQPPAYGFAPFQPRQVVPPLSAGAFAKAVRSQGISLVPGEAVLVRRPSQDSQVRILCGQCPHSVLSTGPDSWAHASEVMGQHIDEVHGGRP